MSFFIKEENVRPGNRGGRSLFNWNDIRLLNNKERESYLGVTQSIGFLDKGGKWRKRDWWQSKTNENLEINKGEILSEKERIKNEEERLFNETFNNLYGTSIPNPRNTINNNNNQKKEKLTVFEWTELMKKEAQINPNDPKIFEFYENDEHKRGLGMKPNISFRTNPYENEALQSLKKIDGEGIEDQEEKDKNEKNKSNNVELNGSIKKSDTLSLKEISSLMKRVHKDKNNLNNKMTMQEIVALWEKDQKEKNSMDKDKEKHDNKKEKNKKKKKGKSKKHKNEAKDKKRTRSNQYSRNSRNRSKSSSISNSSSSESSKSRTQNKRDNRKSRRSLSRSHSRDRSNSYTKRRYKDNK